jgi:hypothetical protein
MLLSLLMILQPGLAGFTCWQYSRGNKSHLLRIQDSSATKVVVTSQPFKIHPFESKKIKRVRHSSSPRN